jgi:hypothetical protein
LHIVAGTSLTKSASIVVNSNLKVQTVPVGEMQILGRALPVYQLDAPLVITLMVLVAKLVWDLAVGKLRDSLPN